MTLASFGRRLTWAALLALAFAVGCGDDGDSVLDDTPTGAIPGEGSVYILHEGGFEKIQASLWLYDGVSGEMTEGVYEAATGQPLGDVGNDIAVVNGALWIVVNNSEKIEILAAGTHAHVGTVEFAGGGSPTSIAVDDSQTTAYVPLRNAGALARIDIASMSVIGEAVQVGSMPVEVALANGKAYVTNTATDGVWGAGTTVSVVDTATFQVVGELEVGLNPTGIVATPDGLVVVLSSGATYGDTVPGAIVTIDSATDEVVSAIPVSSGALDRLELGPDGTVYFLTPGALASYIPGLAAISAQVALAEAVGAGGFHGLGVSPVTGNIYVTDAMDYATAGNVYVFDSTGGAITTLAADIIPRAFAFVPAP